MRHFISALIIILCSAISLCAQTSPWQWAINAGANGIESSSGICADGSGNTYIVGSFASPTIVLGNDTLINGGLDDIYVAKINSSGAFVWAKKIGGASNEAASGITADAFGNIFICGNFESDSLFFGVDTIINTVTSGNSLDFFVLKMTMNGSFLWARSGGGTGVDLVTAVATDPVGKVYFTGNFRSASMTLGPSLVVNNNSGTADAFVARYDSVGNFMWVIRGGGPDHDFGTSLAVDVNYNVYLSGHFASTTFTLCTVSGTNVNPGEDDAYLVKLDTSGATYWLQTVAGSDDDQSSDITTDNLGSVVFVGRHTSGTLQCGALSLINPDSTTTNGFVIKYDAAGTPQWAKTMGGPGNDVFISTVTDNANEIYVTGYYESPTIYFGVDAFNNSTTLPDVFVVKYSVTGSEIGGVTASGPNVNQVSGIAYDGGTSIFITGRTFSPYIAFGTDTLSTNPGFDAYVGKMNGNVVGIEEEFNSTAIRIYPNPFATTAIIESENGFHNATVQIFNSTGQLVREINQLCGDQITISRGELKHGIYLVCIKQEGELHAYQKVIIID